MRHSHGRSFAQILFKITDMVQLSLPTFGIENQLNRLINFDQKSASCYKKIAALVLSQAQRSRARILAGAKFCILLL